MLLKTSPLTLGLLNARMYFRSPAISLHRYPAAFKPLDPNASELAAAWQMPQLLLLLLLGSERARRHCRMTLLTMAASCAESLAWPGSMLSLHNRCQQQQQQQCAHVVSATGPMLNLQKVPATAAVYTCFNQELTRQRVPAMVVLLQQQQHQQQCKHIWPARS